MYILRVHKMTHFSLITHDPSNSMIPKNNNNNTKKQEKAFVPSTSRAIYDQSLQKKNREEEE